MNYEDQVELENSMVDLGISRLNKIRETNKKQGKESENDYSRGIIYCGIEKVTKKLGAFIKYAKSGKAGRKSRTANLLSEFDDLYVVSFIALKVILDGATAWNKRTFNSVAIQIGSRLEDELRYCFYEECDKKYFHDIKHHLRDTRHSRYRRKVLIHHMNKSNHIFEGWKQEDKLRIGAKLVEIIQSSIKLTTTVVRTKGSSKSTNKYLQLTDSAIEWINNQKMNKNIAVPYYQPCIIKPRKWTNPFDGGYHTPRLSKLDIVKTKNKTLLHKLDKANPVNFYNAVNALQEVGWIINKDILRIVKELFDNKSDILDCEPMPLPPKPHDIDTNKVARDKYRYEAAKVHDYNASIRSKRLLILSIINIAEKYIDKTFYHVFQSDFRGRLYCVTPHLNPQGNDLARSLHLFDEPVSLSYTDYSMKWFQIAGYNLWTNDGASFMERSAWVRNTGSRYAKQIASDPIGNVTLWSKANKPFQFLAWCLEYKKYMDDSNYKTGLPIHLDGTNNAYQHIACLTKDEKLAVATNLTKSNRQDLYSLVLEKLRFNLNYMSRFNFSDTRKCKDLLNDKNLDRNRIKKPILMIPYGGTDFGMINYLETKKWNDNITNSHLHFLVKQIRTALDQIFPSCKYVMDYLKDSQATTWTTPSGFIVEQNYYIKESKQVRTKFNESSLWLCYTYDTKTLDKKKIRNSITPNFVHSYDAANVHLALSEVYKAKGFKSLVTIHDSFAANAQEIEPFIKQVKKNLVNLYTWSNRCELYKNLKPLGNFDLNHIINAPYVFS